MGYIHTRRYIIDADSREDLLKLAEDALDESGDDFLRGQLPQMEDVELSEIITHAQEVGDLTDVCKILDEYLEVGDVDMYFEGERLARKRLQDAVAASMHQPPPGSHCLILGDFKVKHFDCDEHPDGTITDVRTGKVVSRSED